MKQVKFSQNKASMQEQKQAADSQALVDDRIKHWLSLEMKKVSQMLIQNLTVFVQQATKLQMDQVVSPELAKHTERLNGIELKQQDALNGIEGTIKDQVSTQLQTFIKAQGLIQQQMNQMCLKAKHPNEMQTQRKVMSMDLTSSHIQLKDVQTNTECDHANKSLMSIFGEGNKLFQKKLEMEKEVTLDSNKNVKENAVEKGNLKISANVAKSLVLASKDVFKKETIDVEEEPVKKAKAEKHFNIFESTMSCESSNNGPKLEQAETEQPRALMNSISQDEFTSSYKLAPKTKPNKPMLTIDTNLGDKATKKVQFEIEAEQIQPVKEIEKSQKLQKTPKNAETTQLKPVQKAKPAPQSTKATPKKFTFQSKKKTTTEKPDQIGKSIEVRLKNGSITSIIKDNRSNPIQKPVIYQLKQTGTTFKIPLKK